MSAPEPLGWCIIEQLGHRRLAGYLTEVTMAGHGFLRLDIPAADGDPGRTMLIAPSSVYAIHPCTEDTARAAASQWRPEPVQPWELKAVAAAPAEDYTGAGWDGDDDDD